MLTPETSWGFECVEFLENVLGWTLLPWQKWLYIHALEKDVAGTGFRFQTIVLLIARQNGKTQWLKGLGLWKLYMDGALGSRGAALTAPYSDEPKSSGLTLCNPDHIESMARWAALHGYQIATHAIGDRAVHLVLDAYEKAGVTGARNLRFRVEHTQVVMPSELSRRRFLELGVIASVQPQHAVSDMPWAAARLGPERIKYAYAYKSLLRSGARLAAGSDFPVEEADPRLILHAAVTRRDTQNNPPAGYAPEQRLSVGEAIRLMTRDAAYAAYAEDRLGQVAVGKAADLTVLGGTLRLTEDSAAPPPDDLFRREVLLTIIAGRVVHDGLAKNLAAEKTGPAGRKKK